MRVASNWRTRSRPPSVPLWPTQVVKKKPVKKQAAKKQAPVTKKPPTKVSKVR